MTGTRKRWIQVGTALGMVPDGVPSEKNGKIFIFFEFFENVIFRFLTYFSSNICYFGILLGR